MSTLDKLQEALDNKTLNTDRLTNEQKIIIDELIRQKKLKATKKLLTPTHIYAPLVMELINEVPILGMSHITGGGICENLPRCIPDGLTANVWYDRYPLKSFKSPDVWHIPNIFYQIVYCCHSSNTPCV